MIVAPLPAGHERSTSCVSVSKRARTGRAFCYHQAAIFGGFVPLVLTLLAAHFGTGLAVMMIIGTWIGCVAWAAAAFTGPRPRARSWCPIWLSPESDEFGPEVIPPA
jgi:hypothetical protein